MHWNDVMKPLIWIIPIVLLIGIISMPREEYPADPQAVRCETVSLINNGNMAVSSEIVSFFHGSKGQYFFENPSNHKFYSKYGILNTLMSIPPLLAEKWWTGHLSIESSSRVIFLNVFNLILSVATAFYFSLIASKYTSSSLVVTIFVLTAFYCTYWWNYLRAQNSEIYQVLFMLAFYYHIISYFRHTERDTVDGSGRTDEWQLCLAGIFLGALILVKTVCVILLPVVFVWIIYLEKNRRRLGSKTNIGQTCRDLLRPLSWIGIPILFALFALLAVNSYKFDSPFESGYGQWKQDNKLIFSGNFLWGMYLLLFNIQGSIFIHFPILIFALIGFPRFFKNYPQDVLLFSICGALLFLLYANMVSPLGLWCYGPRYMLAILPLLSLPFIKTLEILLTNIRKWQALICSVVIALSLSYSCKLQLNVNALPFFTYFQLQGLFLDSQDADVDRYFTSRHFGMINGDILASKNGRPWQVLEILSPKLDAPSQTKLIATINQITPRNYYWWP